MIHPLHRQMLQLCLGQPIALELLDADGQQFTVEGTLEEHEEGLVLVELAGEVYYPLEGPESFTVVADT